MTYFYDIRFHYDVDNDKYISKTCILFFEGNAIMAVYISCENKDTSFVKTSTKKLGGFDFQTIVRDTSEFLASRSAAILASRGQWLKTIEIKLLLVGIRNGRVPPFARVRAIAARGVHEASFFFEG